MSHSKTDKIIEMGNRSGVDKGCGSGEARKDHPQELSSVMGQFSTEIVVGTQISTSENIS